MAEVTVSRSEALSVADPSVNDELDHGTMAAGKISLVDILELAGERTFGFLLVLLALPSALPIPAPGYSMPFGMIIVLLAAQMVIGRHRPWFPKQIRNSSLKRQHAQNLMKAGLPWLRRLESISRPRFSFMCNSVIGRIAMGLAIALMGAFMMIPIPGTNTIPAMIVFILGFSLIEEDGLISIFGLAAGLVGGGSVVLALIKGIPLLMQQIQNVL